MSRCTSRTRASRRSTPKSSSTARRTSTSCGTPPASTVRPQVLGSGSVGTAPSRSRRGRSSRLAKPSSMSRKVRRFRRRRRSSSGSSHTSSSTCSQGSTRWGCTPSGTFRPAWAPLASSATTWQRRIRPSSSPPSLSWTRCGRRTASRATPSNSACGARRGPSAWPPSPGRAAPSRWPRTARPRMNSTTSSKRRVVWPARRKTSRWGKLPSLAGRSASGFV
mmetsp:Transcript_72297/g.189479  ORF Transcript_72297/g.189479 Transcript_72297/m.189479 type:complete len:221 (-) Transcript_72297:696-1358(-)